MSAPCEHCHELWQDYEDDVTEAERTRGTDTAPHYDEAQDYCEDTRCSCPCHS